MELKEEQPSGEPLLMELKEEHPSGEQEALPSQADTNPETDSKTVAGTQRLLDLGFKKGPSSDLYMTIQSNDEVLAFMKKKAFLQSAGGQNNGEYKKWRCAHAYTAAKCHFVLFQFGDFERPNSEFALTLGKYLWHNDACSRAAKGQLGLLPAEKRVALASKTPRAALLEIINQKEKSGGDFKKAVNLEGVTKRKIVQARRYAVCQKHENFFAKPAEYIANLFPKCECSIQEIDGCTVCFVSHAGLRSHLLEGDNGGVDSDATYWIAPRNGHCVTVGIEVKGPSFLCFARFRNIWTQKKKCQRPKSTSRTFLRSSLKQLSENILRGFLRCSLVAMRSSSCTQCAMPSGKVTEVMIRTLRLLTVCATSTSPRLIIISTTSKVMSTTRTPPRK